MLSDRRQRILYALIEEYVAHALPVGSQTIAKHYKLGVSSATIRNELSYLEDQGYITQPHTSAGRIPTDAGYREFVDEVLASDELMKLPGFETMASDIRSRAEALDSLIERTSEELTRLTDCLSIVMAPSIIKMRIRQVSLISLTNRQALIVIVSEDGHVAERHVSFPIDVEPDRLHEIQNVLTKVFSGRSLSEMYDVRLGMVDLMQDSVGPIIVNEVLDSLHDCNSVRRSRVGVSSLMRKPEFHDASALLPIMEVLEDDTVLFRVFDPSDVTDSGIMVRIGSENETEQLSGASVIAGSYGRGDAQGVVAVIGPKRMDYSKVIGAVRAAQEILNEDLC